MRYVIVVLAAAGIVVSFLALAAHYAAPVQPVDLLHSNWNSAYVNQSPYAEIHGWPVAVLGIAGYALLVLLALLRRRVLMVYFAIFGLLMRSTLRMLRRTFSTCGVYIAFRRSF